MITDEGIRNIDRYSQKTEMTKETVNEAINFILQKIDGNLKDFTYKFPAPASKNNRYEAIENRCWTSCFWTGMLWLAYEKPVFDLKMWDI